MDHRTHFLDSLAYERWANLRIIRAFSSEAQANEHAHRILSHLLLAIQTWGDRLRGVHNETKVWELIPWDELEGVMDKQLNHYENLVRNWPVDDFGTLVSYSNSKGQQFETSREDIIHHVIRHSAYHRGQLILKLKEYTTELPVTDFIAYVRETR